MIARNGERFARVSLGSIVITFGCNRKRRYAEAPSKTSHIVKVAKDRKRLGKIPNGKLNVAGAKLTFAQVS